MSALAQRTALDAARDVVAAVGAVEAAYAVGSAATGAFEPGTSDLDVVVVLPGEPTPADLERLVERVRSVEVKPARGLELVAYARGRVVLNLNTGPGMEEHVGLADDDPSFWFVLDRAAAEQQAVALAAPQWRDIFAPVTRSEVLDALAESLRWHETHEPTSRNTVLNATRAWRWLEAGEWVSKPDTARWLLARVRERVEAAR